MYEHIRVVPPGKRLCVPPRTRLEKLERLRLIRRSNIAALSVVAEAAVTTRTLL
jgi:hypothetical protein